MEAESLYVEAIKAGERILGKEHPDLAHILNGYADLLLMTHRVRRSTASEILLALVLARSKSLY